MVRHRKLLAFLCIAFLASSALLFSRSGSDKEPITQQPPSEERILLLSSDRPGSNTFTSSVAQAAATSRLPGTFPSPGARAPSQLSGALEDLYAATRGTSGCDASRLGTLLKSNPSKARSWAAASRIAAADIGGYLDALTPAFTRLDIRVTDYGLMPDGPVGRQAVMQAGTAVLLDRMGIPRVRCISGNPLGPPRSVAGTVGYIGSGWAGFRYGVATTVEPAPDPVPAFILFDLATGHSFARIPGTVDLIDIDKPAPGAVLKVLQPGQQSTVSGTLWPRSITLTITFDNPEVTLAEANPDTSGNFAVEVTVPKDADPGIHHVAVAGGGFRVDQTVYVIPPSVRVAAA